MSFASQLNDFARKAQGNVDQVYRKIALSIARALILKSPVDTGRFRANWMLGVGELNIETTNETDPDGNATIMRLAAEIDAHVRAGEVVFISNCLPYAIPLEYGHSGQAPQGMVRLTVQEWKSYLQDAISEVIRK